MLLFLLAVVLVIGAIAVAGDQGTKQGAQGAFTEAVYSCVTFPQKLYHSQ